MTDIEQKALALVADILPEDAYRAPDHFIDKRLMWNALCRAIEQHEQFKREVSDAVETVFDVINDTYSPWTFAYGNLSRFILPKPDPLVEALRDLQWLKFLDADLADANELRAALAKRGGRVVWEIKP